MPASSRSAEAEGRGAGWVVLQFVLMAAILVAGFFPPHWPDVAEAILRIVSSLLALAGAGLAVVSVRALGSSMTPYPEPRAGAELVDRGPYGIVRHPIYAAGLLFFTGFSLFASVPALVLTAVLGIVWWSKAASEERRLEQCYPGYAGYRRRVPHRFIPGLL